MLNLGPLPPSTAPLRFGPSQRFELQPAERRLLIDGQPAALGRRALDLLIALAEQPDHLLSKHELLDRVWPGLVVEEANLQMQVSNLRKLLGGDMIATVPGRGYRFAAVVERPAPTTQPVIASAPVAPYPTAHRLIGRDDDLAALEQRLEVDGCLTLVGTSGVGKTSLARAALARRPDRSVWVDLAALTDASQLTGALARALDLHLVDGDDAISQLVTALRGQALLLVLDNAEHLIDACAALATRLRPLDGVRLLVTSQAPLAVAGERVLRLEPLALPGPDTTTPEGALALLIERIVATDHRFVVTPAAWPLLRTLCTQLDGLPLALEMAAARVPLLGLKGVHDALAERFALLTRGHRDAATRHRTLHHALEWSYRLLEPALQRRFRALGVFADGFSLDLAVAVTADAAESRWEVIDGLSALSDRSLLVVGAGDPPRYRLLETMRAFAIGQLTSSTDGPSEIDVVRRRLVQALITLFARYAPGDAAITALCLAEMENARDALSWAARHDLALAAQLSARITTVTTFSVWRHESGNWLLALEPAMSEPAGQALPRELQAMWWMERARIGAIRRDAAARVSARHAVDLWRPLDQPKQLLRATLTWVRSIATADDELAAASAELQALLTTLPDLTPRERFAVQGALTRAAVIRSDYAAVLAGREIELTLAKQLGDRDAMDAAESGIVSTLGTLGRHEESAARGRALLALVDADGNARNGNLPWVLGALMSALLALGRLDEARALLPRVFETGRRFAAPMLILHLCDLAATEQRHGAAARLVGYMRATYESRGITFEPNEAAGLARVLAAAEAALGAAQTHALIERGRSLTEDAAEALAAGHEFS